MERLAMETGNITDKNIQKILELFPNVATESRDENGKLKTAIDFNKLKQELSEDIVDGQETYDFTWVGKREAMIEANRPIRKTLRPDRESSVNWDTTENIYIEGDNLDALKLLQESYMGKIKMIYIDPPYNTGKDFVYRDNRYKTEKENDKDLQYKNEDEEINFSKQNELFLNTESNNRFHSDWCSMMYPRLKLARNLLSDDGVIFISIDDNEIDNLKKICDEVFGVNNFVVDIAWQCLDTVKNDAKYFSDNHEYILIYGKNKEFLNIRGIKKTEKQRAYYKNFDNDDRGDYLLTPLHAKSGSVDSIYTYTFSNGQVWTPPQGTYPRFSKETLENLEKDNRIYLDPNCKNVPQKKTFWIETSDRMPATSFWSYMEYGSTRQSNKELATILEKGMFLNPKPTKLLYSLIDILDNAEQSVILDFFSGSATTAHAVMKLNAEDGGNRKFIMVQLPEVCDEKSEAYKAGYKNICQIGEERIRRAGKKIQEEHPDKKIDIGFRVFKVDDTNMKDVYYTPNETAQKQLGMFESNIKDDRTDEDLLYGCLLDWGVELSLPHKVEVIDGKRVHIVNDQEGFEPDLIACFEDSIPESVIRKIAKKKPTRVVFRDSSFVSDDNKINVEEIFKLITPDTKVKVI